MTPLLQNQENLRSRWYCPPYLSIIVGLFVLAGCFDDVPRDNPFDPRSDDYEPSSQISGLIVDRTSQPVSGTLIHLESQLDTAVLRSTSDSQGRYNFKEVLPGEYRLSVEKQDFAIEQDSFSVTAFEDVTKDFVLNGVPRFEQVQIRTAHINRIWPPPVDFTLLEVVAHVSDLDGSIDLEKAWIEVPGLGVSDTLMFTQEAGVFSKDLDVASLNVANMQSILGEELILKAEDRLGYISQMPSLQVARIINETPVVSSPQVGAVLSDPQPQLTWVCQQLPFSFYYRVEVIRIDDVVRNSVTILDNLNPAALCMDQEGSSEQAASVQVDVQLDVGSYFWTVSIVDDFGNWSRSKEAGFVIN